MEFDLSKAQKLLQDSARTFFKRSCPTEKVRELISMPTAHDPSLWTEMADQGWTGITLAEERGGIGLGLVDLAALAEEMGRACLPGPFLSNFWATSLLAHADNANAADPFLEAIAEGKLIGTVAYLEEGASWCPNHVQAKAEKQGDALVLNGTKMFVGDAAATGLILCVARMGDGLVVAPITQTQEGVTVTATPGIDEGRKLYEIALKNVKVPASSIVALGKGARDAIERSIAEASVFVCAEAVGLMQWMLETAVEYAKTRQQFDKPIGSFQAVQHQCADMLMYTESARSAAYYAAWTLQESHPDADKALAIAKAYCSDAVRETANRCCQVHGGIGFTWEHDLHLYYKRAKSAELLFGDASSHREKLASLVL
ncbi:MAG: acyl-CoA dehydrogenase family protein [Planctomycetota bacterium]